MNIVLQRKVQKIHSELQEYRKLRKICDYSFKRYILTRNYLWSSTYNPTYKKDEIILCDSELTNIIREYCDKKINQLERQLNYYGAKYGGIV